MFKSGAGAGLPAEASAKAGCWLLGEE